MTIRAWKINGKNLNYYDHDVGALDYALVNSGIIEGMVVSAWQVSTGRAILITKRTSVTPEQKFWVHIEITATETIDTTWTKKVWIALNPTYINDGTLATNPMGTQLATVQTGASYPADSAYYIPLASITGGVITDEREFITTLPLLRKGFSSNKHVRINRSTGLEEVKNVTDWSNIASTDKIRFEKASWEYEDMPVSLLQNSIAGMTSEYIFGGSASVNESCYISNLSKWRNATTPLAAIGKTVATTSFPMYSSGNVEQRYTFYFKKTGTPQDLTFRIETDNGSGSPSGTLVNANAVLATAIASITSDAVYEIVLPASFNLWPAGTPIHFVFWQWSQYVNASNYIEIGINDEVCVVHDRVTSPGSNLSTSRAITGGSGTTSNSTQSTQVDCIADCQLVSINSWYQVPTVTLFEVFNVTDNVTLYKDPTTQTGVTLREPVQLKSGKRYELRYTFSGTLNNISGYTSMVNTAHLQWVSSAGGNSIQWVTTRTATFTPNVATLSTYISKANATNAIKSAVYAMLPQGASAGSYPSIVKDRYLWGFSSLIKGTTYYLSNTGVISSTAGTVSKVLGVAISSTTIRLDSAINAS